MTSVANSTWELVVWNEGAQLLSTVRGPETQASTAPVPRDSRSAGILFAHGVHMPHLPVSALVDGRTPPSRASDGRLRLAGRAWPLPGWGTAEALVQRLGGARGMVGGGAGAGLLGRPGCGGAAPRRARPARGTGASRPCPG